MKKFLNIFALLLLLVLSSSLLVSKSADQNRSVDSEVEYVYSGSNSISDEHSKDYLPTHSPVLFGAENLQDVRSEIDPRTSISAKWSSNKRLFTSQFNYLIRSSLFELSQSLRIRIFPFHSFL